jgi:hypothetical protein
MNRDTEYTLDEPAGTTPELLYALAAWERSLRRKGAAQPPAGHAPVPPAIPTEVHDATAVAATAVEYVDLQTPPALPEQVDDRRRWLLEVGELYLVLDGARRLAANPGGGRSWAGALADALAGAAARRLALLRSATGLWAFGNLAESSLREIPNSEPWKSVLSSSEAGSFGNADAATVVRLWALGDLSARNADFLREAVGRDAAWRESYRGYLEGRLREVRYLDMDHRLFIHPVLTVPLPHLGQSLEISPAEKDFLVRWGSAQPRAVSPEDGVLKLAGDSTTGPLAASLKSLEPHLLQIAFQAARATAELVETDEIPNATILSLASGIADVLGNKNAPTDWFKSLVSAAAAFEEGRDPSEEQEIAVGHALAARVGLELLSYRAGTDDSIFPILQRIDDSLKDVAGAVMLLDDAEYFGALGDVEPRAGSWWSERAEITERIPSEALDTALEEWGAQARRQKGHRPDPVLAADLAVTALAAWQRLTAAVDRKTYHLRQAFAASLAVVPIAAAAGVQDPLRTADKMASERRDWYALLSVPKPRTVEIRFGATSDSVAPLPERSYVWFKGLRAELGGRDLSHPDPVLFDLGSASTETTASEPPELAIITPGGTVIAFRPDEAK